MAAYTSCNCKWCRHSPSKVKCAAKKEAHRKMRRQSKAAIKADREVPTRVSTGRKF